MIQLDICLLQNLDTNIRIRKLSKQYFLTIKCFCVLETKIKSLNNC